MAGIPNGAEIVRFEGDFERIPDMHLSFEEAELMLSYPARVAGTERLVYWIHTTKRPEGYNFVEMDPDYVRGRRKAPHTVYDLVIEDPDDGDAFARLYTIHQLGTELTKDLDRLDQEWHQFQIVGGLVVPSVAERSNFTDIFRAFCSAADNYQETTTK